MKSNFFYTIVIVFSSLALAGCTDQVQQTLEKLQQAAAGPKGLPTAATQPQSETPTELAPITQEATQSSTPDQPMTDTEMIIAALSARHGWIPKDIIVTVSKNTGQFASGGVREIASEVGGGYWFAVKTNGIWQIVADGNGTISCADLTIYPDYPADMIPECWEESTGEIIYR